MAVVPLRRPPVDFGLSDRVLALIPYPELPGRDSQGQSASHTKAAHSRTFSEVKEWPQFNEKSLGLAWSLDEQQVRHGNPWSSLEQDGLPAASCEIGVHVALEGMLFPAVNKLAERLGLRFRYRSGGSGRSLSQADLVILDSQMAQDMGNLSARVFGNGETKGPWQWELKMDTLLQEFASVKHVEVIQQLFGDMVMDETRYGFLTNFNQTVFFRRSLTSPKALEVSPVVRVEEAPVIKFLFVLREAELDRAAKASLDRTRILMTPENGYQITVPVPEQERPELEDEAVPLIPTSDVVISGKAVGLGRFGTVLEGRVKQQKVALKCYDLRHEEAAEHFANEVKTYKALSALQGDVIPRLVALGRMPHCNVLYLALTFEGSRHAFHECIEEEETGEIVRQVWAALRRIHEAGVMHGDLKPSHILWRDGPKIIDFNAAKLCATREDLEMDIQEMKEIIEQFYVDASYTARVHRVLSS